MEYLINSCKQGSIILIPNRDLPLPVRPASEDTNVEVSQAQENRIQSNSASTSTSNSMRHPNSQGESRELTELTEQLGIANRYNNIDEDHLLQDFYHYVNRCEQSVLKKAITDFKSLNSVELNLLNGIFHTFHFYEFPREDEVKEQIILIATETIIDKPKNLVDLIRQGFSIEEHKEFWEQCDFKILLELQMPTKAKIINCLKYTEDLTNEQQTILHYLEIYIRSMDSENLRSFVFFVTGSCQMPDFIQVEFNELIGLAIRPIVKTCSNVLQLSCHYQSYQEFKKNMNAHLFSEDSLQYTSV
ncbi:hypothetical protein FQR65_LT19118 [Abscondita terminalis]|nr:hypothetical protein FQR65_LT19118 [Abscondita terminalis]